MKDSVKTVVLIGSLLLNIILMAGILWISFGARDNMMDLVAESSESMVQLQQEILTDLESNERNAVEKVKKKLRFNIDVQSRVSFMIRTKDPVPFRAEPENE